ncbi:HAMP domain-containing histidine kinase [Gordonia sp. X0973]|uniref:sensor histidine kinase n=1 Tax=Gordonia sp. X0973 TaxID=2742602 RepID=UPI000F53CB9C|nr:HAMP domain-containing sensor histidine kinase [Gordonia sp. X0973]QKT06215.1 HAMP domain-containing histidine kinase [Gordonia sp. X0973]
MARIPLRISLVVLAALLVVAGLTVSGILVSRAMREDLFRRVDSQLSAAVQTWARPRDPKLANQRGPASARRPPSNFYVRVALGEGVMVRSNDSGFNPDVRSVEDNPAEHVGPVTVPSVEAGGPEWRVIKSSNPHGESIVAMPLTLVDETASRLVRLQLTVGIVVISLMSLLSYLLVQRSLRPLRRVEETAHAIAEGDLDERVPESSPHTEVGSLANSFNLMLARIQEAFAAVEASERQARASEEKMRRFVADAGHELRTPLTSIKGFAELYQQGAVTDADDAFRRVNDEATRMSLLVSDLMMLAHLDADRPIERAPVKVSELALEAVHSALAAAPDRIVELEAPDPSPVVLGDHPRLMQVLRNLINNAVAHTPPSASIMVSVIENPASHTVRMQVADDGPGLTEEDKKRVFDRFFRGDSSRSRGANGAGNGLGLSIVSALVAAHGGQVGVDSEPGHGATFWVDLPAASAAVGKAAYQSVSS